MPTLNSRERQGTALDAISPKRVVVVGQGYVGLPLAMAAVDAGYVVIGYEIDEGRVESLRTGESYVEDITGELLRKCLDSGRYVPTANSDLLTEFDVAIITVPTPLNGRRPDLSFIQAASKTLATHLRPGALVVLESTTYPGTTEEVVRPILEFGSGLSADGDFFVGYSPERIDPGNLTWNFSNTPKIVSGINLESLEKVDEFYSSITRSTVSVSGTREAELSKLLENTFRHVNIALVNELAIFAADLRVDLWEAIDAASTKPYGFMKFSPGPGVGGHCLPIDPTYLSWMVMNTLGRSFRFIELANDVNDHMPDYVVSRISAALNLQLKAVNGSRILLIGIAYKKNTSDFRESPGPVICELLSNLGAEVRVADTHVRENGFPDSVTHVLATPEEIRSADLVVIITDHDDFDWEAIADNAQRILDTRHRLPPSPIVEYL
jgi:UDP-N-acetyl-D-glucosamine dehydrogenase